MPAAAAEEGGAAAANGAPLPPAPAPSAPVSLVAELSIPQPIARGKHCDAASRAAEVSRNAHLQKTHILGSSPPREIPVPYQALPILPTVAAPATKEAKNTALPIQEPDKSLSHEVCAWRCCWCVFTCMCCVRLWQQAGSGTSGSRTPHPHSRARPQERESRITEIIKQYTHKLEERTAHHMGWVRARMHGRACVCACGHACMHGRLPCVPAPSLARCPC